MQLQGKTALVCGAGRNSGKAIALAFAEAGADLILVAKQFGEQLNDVARQCEKHGVKVLPVLADMSKHQEVNKVVEQALATFGKVDILVNVLGLRPHKLPWEYTYEEWEQVFAVNLHSTFFLIKALAPGMIERKTGSIVVLGGSASLTTASPYAGATAASKHGLYGLIKSLAHAFGPHGVRANLIALSGIENERVNPEWYQDTGGDPNTRGKLARTPLGRFGTPQEVASVALFLASDESSYVTGDRICCSGGGYM